MLNVSLMDRGQFAAKFYEAMCRAGYDVDGLLQQFGLSAEMLKKPDFSFSHDAHRIIWPVLESFTRNADIGLTIGQNLPSSRGNIFCTLHFSYPNFGEALYANLQFSRLVSDALDWTIGQNQKGIYVQVRSPDPEIQNIRHLFECLVLGSLEQYSEITRGQFKASKIEFACPAPEVYGERSEIYGCEAFFDCAEHRIYFRPELLEIPFSNPDQSLTKMHADYAQSLLRKIEDADILLLTRQIITDFLVNGDITLEQVSHRLGLTSSELKYRLEKMNTCFLKERESCRQQFVFNKLKDISLSITDVALQAGFSEPSTFYRAFKRWSGGETPAAFRARHVVSLQPVSEAKRTVENDAVPISFDVLLFTAPEFRLISGTQ